MLSFSAISLEPDYDHTKTDRDLQISAVGETEREKQRGEGFWGGWDKRKDFLFFVCDLSRCDRCVVSVYV